jgi:hypothetical protein
MKKRTIFQIVYAIFILALLYYLKVPLNIIITFAILIAVILLLKGKLYQKIKNTFEEIKFFKKLNPKLKKILIIITFILIFIIIKQIIYFILGFFGIDLETVLTESINNTISQ